MHNLISLCFALCLAFGSTEAKTFNQPLDSWDVGRVTDMRLMFLSKFAVFALLGALRAACDQLTGIRLFLCPDASTFNQPLESWDTKSVTNMHRMFEGKWVHDYAG